jgi:hypothetical protein
VSLHGNVGEGEHRQVGFRSDLCDARPIHSVRPRRDDQGTHSFTSDRLQSTLELCRPLMFKNADCERQGTRGGLQRIAGAAAAPPSSASARVALHDPRNVTVDGSWRGAHCAVHRLERLGRCYRKTCCDDRVP